MKLSIKSYKTYKVKRLFKTTRFFFFCHGISLDIKNWVRVEQDLALSKLNYYRLYNTLTKKSVKTSIFKHLSKLINGPLLLIEMEQKKGICQTLEKIIEVNRFLTILCVRLNDKFYSTAQLGKIKTLIYTDNILILNRFLRFLLKRPHRRFHLKQKRVISK